ncbi:MAG TPA: DUF1476 domain-containing protein [Hypericibacter adhaerens]|jgi:hypothetical protein|uniref:Aldolase n=1 Tax=Hypericibacter adhaerens TaxID=2602016 RepID=A0A5J6N559_9PROT|nr:DUF1476 domain-containing protein [Hypericibacter adhaerens]QEX23670.1 hypothetical protein FRZ61_36090 [Hypericibacter adhaerens]HWA42124.1 DUF1476 domain-containing protein [Hypericibacter adhaerens]
MSALDDREKALEDKFKHDQELEFRVHARRNRLLGLWAAQELRLPPAEHEAYAKSLVMAEIELHGSDAVVKKLLADFTDRGIEMSDHRVRRHLSECQELARRQVMAEVKG